MKTFLAMVVSLVIGAAVATMVANQRQASRYAAQAAQLQAAWEAEKAQFEAALEEARGQGREPAPAPPARILTVTNRVSPAEILARLQTLRTATNSARSARLVIHEFERLIEAGPAALPAIREFLRQNVDVDYDAASRRRGRMPTEFNLPPTLRLGLFEAAKRIGGDGAAQVLVEALQATGRGAEVAYLAFALQEMQPNTYRETALAAARQLLARPAVAGATNPWEKLDRDYLYDVLTFYQDGTYVAAAQAQVIQPGGQVDAVALRYLQQALGERSVAVAAQAWQDPRVPADQKEPLARVALTYAGADPQADQLYQAAINDPGLKPDQRRNLIEDLNEAGFADPKHLTPADLALIQKRIGMIEQLAPGSMDQINAAAFQEAYKDLVNMQNSLLPKPVPAK